MKPRVQSLLNQINSGQLKNDMSRILNHIKTYPLTTLPEIKRKLGIVHQTASARISDLLDMGLIEEKEEKKTTTGVHSYFKYQPDPRIQSINALKRKKEKFENWKKKGINQFQEFINNDLKRELSCTK